MEKKFTILSSHLLLATLATWIENHQRDAIGDVGWSALLQMMGISESGTALNKTFYILLQIIKRSSDSWNWSPFFRYGSYFKG